MKKYNMLTEKLPESVVVAGMEYPIRAGFRTGILFEELMHSQKSDEDKISGMLALYYPTLPENLFGAVDAAIGFLPAGRTGKMRFKMAQGYQESTKKSARFHRTQPISMLRSGSSTELICSGSRIVISIGGNFWRCLRHWTTAR